MTEPIAQAEAYIQFRLDSLASANEHHRFEEIATRIARKRISANILLATGPVSAGGDQGRDAESFTTRIPDELPQAAGFAASASTEPVAVACTVQRTGLKPKVLADVDSICAADADRVAHIAYFSVHPISAGVTHALKKAVRDKYNVSLDVFSGADLAMLLAEPDLVWVARQYLDLPSSMIPPPEDEPAPQWYAELISKLRQNGGPAALTPATQGEVTQGLRHATWDAVANADLPEWLDFMGAFLADSRDGEDTDLVFRACYEMSVARFRGTGSADGVEDLTRRAIIYACASDHPNVVDDAVTLASYWGVMWVTGVGRAEAQEIFEAVVQLRDHAVSLLGSTNASSHPVRAASLTGTLAYLHLLPDWRRAEEEHGRPPRVEVAPHAGVKLEEVGADVSGLSEDGLIGVAEAMNYLDSLVDLLPHARVYAVSTIATLFDFMAPVVAGHPSYRKIRDGLDAATADVEGEAAKAERCRDRGSAFVKAGKSLLALAELHNAKVSWLNGDTLYGSVLTMRFIATLYSGLGLSYAAKMYACTAAAIAAVHGEDELNEQLPKALLEAAGYVQRAGCWVDGAGLSSAALLARASHLPEPFDLDKYPELDNHHTNSLLELSLVRKLWPDLESLIADAYSRTPEWFSEMSGALEMVGENPMSEEEFAVSAPEQLTGPVFGDLGAERLVDFAALGVRWSFTFANDRATVLTSESLVAAFQIFLADIATYDPVVLGATVHVTVDVRPGVDAAADAVVVDRHALEPTALIILSHNEADRDAQRQVLVRACFELLDTVVSRPSAELYALMDPMFEAGLMHKLFIGRPYEEVADLLDEAHYARCSAAHRPGVSARFSPRASGPLAASRTTGAGYDHDRSLELIRERYEVAGAVLRYTLPRLLAEPAGRAAIEALRDEGWLDWQILVALVNTVWNWRMRNAGIVPGVGDKTLAMRLAREPETVTSPQVPLGLFSETALKRHLQMQTYSVAARWELTGRTESIGDAMRNLLIRRYHFTEDDVPHLDLLLEAVVDGVLQPLLVAPDEQ